MSTAAADEQESEMRARSSLLVLVAAGLVVAGCVSKHPEDPQVPAERTCGNTAAERLHMTSSADKQQDPEIESLLTQQTGDLQLQQINRRMYQSMHSLDVELRRQQRIAACQQPTLSALPLEARSNDSSGTGAGSSSGAGGQGGESSGAGATAEGTGTVSSAVAPGGGVGGGVGGGGVGGAGSGGGGLSSGATVAANTGVASTSGTTVGSTATPSPMTGSAGAGHGSTLRKGSSPAKGGGGNGATAQKVTAGTDNEVVARRLRRAAEQETNPTLRAKLWKEYQDYRQGTSIK